MTNAYKVTHGETRASVLIPAAESGWQARKAVAESTGKPASEYMSERVEIRTASIPFAGFYESTHIDTIDRTIEQMFSDDYGDAIDSLVERAQDAIDYRRVHLAYAQHYASTLADACNAEWYFDCLDSPRFYNYRSDEIDVNITLTELRRMLEYVESDALAALVKKRLTARDGFVPHYSNDLSEWGDLEMWESPQLSLLIECYCDEYEDADSRDWHLVDDCNGEVTAMIESAMPGDVLQSLYNEQESAIA